MWKIILIGVVILFFAQTLLTYSLLKISSLIDKREEKKSMIRKRPKRYPYSKSQYEYSCRPVYLYGENKPYFKMWFKRNVITGEVGSIYD